MYLLDKYIVFFITCYQENKYYMGQNIKLKPYPISFLQSLWMILAAQKYKLQGYDWLYCMYPPASSSSRHSTLLQGVRRGRRTLKNVAPVSVSLLNRMKSSSENLTQMTNASALPLQRDPTRSRRGGNTPRPVPSYKSRRLTKKCGAIHFRVAHDQTGIYSNGMPLPQFILF